jgi:hypothetical protein
MVNKGTSKVINKRTSPPRLNKSAKSLNKLPLRSSVRTVGGRRRAAIIELIKTTENKNIEKKSKTRLRI